MFGSNILTEAICRMVANNNNGFCEVTEQLIRDRIHCYYAEYTKLSPLYTMYGDNEKLEISANGDLMLTLTWKEVHELNTISEQEVVNC